jgi:hypothetical protein
MRNPRSSDDPPDPEIGYDESREELLGRGGGTGIAIYDVIAIVLAVVGAAIAFETIDHWSQWLVLGAIIATVIGFMIAVSPNRPRA